MGCNTIIQYETSMCDDIRIRTTFQFVKKMCLVVFNK